jgi:hypothetical protein
MSMTQSAEREQGAGASHPYLLAKYIRVSDQDQKLQQQWGDYQEMFFCPTVVGEIVNTANHRRFPARCRSRACLHCNRILARQLDKAIALAQPTRMVTFTGLTGVWPVDKKMFRNLRRYLGRDGLPITLAWATEVNPQGTGHHAHAWGYAAAGDLDEGRLYQRAKDVGLGETFTVSVTYRGRFTYVMKSATWNQASLDAHRRVNGSELLHARGFWRDAETGTHLTMEQAISAAYNEQRDPNWRFEPGKSLGRRSSVAARVRAERHALKDHLRADQATDTGAS